MNSSNVTSYPVSYLHTVYQHLNFYLTIFVLFPGWFLNFFMAAIFAQKKFWRGNEINIGYTYTILALSSNLAVTIGILNFFPAVFNIDLQLLGGVGVCRLIWFIRLFSVLFSQYFQAQMTVTRAISIIYPRRFPWLNKTSNLLKITTVIMLLTALYALLQLFRHYNYQETVYNSSTLILTPVSCTLSTTLIYLFDYSFFLVRQAGLLICLMADTFIIRKLIISKRTTQNTGSHISNKEVSFALSILWSNIFHVAIVIPFLVIVGIQLTPAYMSGQDTDYVAYVNQLYVIMNWGNYLYEALLFYISLASNKIFRSEVSIIFISQRSARVSNDARRVHNKNTTPEH